ncbi:MAG: hypothetical protein AB1714_16240 [Acidobacteriota bacterium]
MKDEQLSPFLNGLEPAEPPPELRRLVLTPARRALAQAAIRDRWAGIWGNPILRLAWLGCVVALLVCHLAISLQPRKPNKTLAISPRERDDLVVTADMRPIRLDARPLIGALAIHDDEAARSIYPAIHTTIGRSNNDE